MQIGMVLWSSKKRCSWGAPPFLVVVVLGSIGFFGVENGSDNSL